MSSIFIIGLSDSYTKEKLFQLQSKKNKTTVEFDELVRVATEIQQAKENCLEAGSTSMCGVSGGPPGKKPKGELSACHRCNTTSHSSKGFSLEGKNIPGKKAKASVLSAEEAVTETAVSATAESSAVSTVPATVPAAALNSIKQVQPYQFNPERYSDYSMENSGWWSLEAVKPIQTQILWATMEATTASPALGHYLFDNVKEVWRSAPPPSHAAKHVHVEIDRRSYIGQGRSKVNRKSLDSWCFPDSGAQVTLISPALVKALGGDGLVQRATLQIKGPTGHIMNTSGCIFIVISKRNEKTGLVTKTHQQTYISVDVEDIVLSREAMESLRFVSDLDDRKKATVRLVSNTMLQPFYSKSSSPVAGPVTGKSSSPGVRPGKSPVASISSSDDRHSLNHSEIGN